MNKICKYCGTEHALRGNACLKCKDGLYRYGLNRIQQEALLESQGSKCKICDKELKMFSGHLGGFIDHNHKTGKVRGVLCNRCNTVVGGLEAANLEKILEYIGV